MFKNSTKLNHTTMKYELHNKKKTKNYWTFPIIYLYSLLILKFDRAETRSEKIFNFEIYGNKKLTGLV